jgi:LPXTG-motif cell wall-anchored protein
VVLPGGTEHGSMTTFYIILAVCVAVVGGLLLFLRKKRFL